MVAPMSVPRDAVGVCVLGDRLMAVGGYDGQQYLTLVEAYDPHLNEWEPVRINLHKIQFNFHRLQKRFYQEVLYFKVAPLKAGRAGPPCVVIKNMPGFGFD